MESTNAETIQETAGQDVSVMTEERHCEVCGRPFEMRVGVKGRPQRYCDDQCREFNAALSVLMKYIDVVRERCTKASWKFVRSRLFELCNLRPWNKGVKDGIPKSVIRGANGKFMKKKRR